MDDNSPKLIKVKRVYKTATDGILMANIDAMINGVQQNMNFIINPSDPYGLAPEIRARIEVGDIKIRDYVPPTDEETRAFMPGLTPVQFRLMLVSIDVTEQMVDEAIKDDDVAGITWKWATTFTRLDPMTVKLADSIGIDPAELDTLWMWAFES